MTDLFGNEDTGKEYAGHHQSPMQRILGPLNYRPSTDKAVRCSTCSHHMLHCAGRVYHKCDLVGCTLGPGTDIMSRWVCDAWEKTEEAQG
jgi:hypothetical protein